LHYAGFTSGGKTLRTVYRPSQLAARIWQHGLEYHGKPVDIQFIQTRQAVSDHFVAVWKREYTSPGRLYRKYFSHSHTRSGAPIFDPRDETMPMDTSAWSDPCTTKIGIGRPSDSIGVNLGYVLGEQPVFVCRLTNCDAPELEQPLLPFPGKLDRQTRLKKYLLFSRPVIAFLRRNLESNTEWFSNIPNQAIPAMLRTSPEPNRQDAFVYNYVLTGNELRIKRLLNNNGHDNRFVNWLLAKHVLLSGYSRDVRLAGELWRYDDPVDGLTIFISPESGTYKPDEARVLIAAVKLAEFYGVKVVPITREQATTM
jgi:hypothetical protein